ncbi:MAG TPA: TQO small subunit DoxD [Cryptosporangiaceae bacterium]|nr:TQO small subunit DoxD [Cryptosporangiaceae bacterium]
MTTIERAVPVTPAAPSRVSRVLLAALRIGVALMWIQGASWKTPPAFGQGDKPSGLFKFTSFAVEHEVFAPWAWVVENLVLPNFTVFGWTTLLVEASLGAFLLVGLATRLWALVGIGQSMAILLSVANAPHEWVWAYVLMVLAHLAIFATAAGRYYGLDGVLRERWGHTDGRLARLLRRAS